MRQEPFVVPGKLVVPYRYFVGRLASKALIALRDDKKVMGVRCPTCNLTYMPPRSTCGRCFSKLEELVEVGDKGTVLTYTVVYHKEPVHPMEPPFVYGLIKLDGADTALPHFIGEVEPEKVSIGMKVQAVFKDKREGNILDIKYFKPQ